VIVTPCPDNPQPADLVLTREGDGRGPWTRTWLRTPERGHAAYVILDGDGGALYVGQTRRPRERLREHAKNSWGRWFHAARAIVLFPVASEADARIAELGLADALRPRHSEIAPGERGRLRRLLAAEHAELVNR
jgi:hypothetical protein